MAVLQDDDGGSLRVLQDDGDDALCCKTMCHCKTMGRFIVRSCVITVLQNNGCSVLRDDGSVCSKIIHTTMHCIPKPLCSKMISCSVAKEINRLPVLCYKAMGCDAIQ